MKPIAILQHDRLQRPGVKRRKPPTFLRVAVNVVFGTPFLATLAFALRAPLWWRHSSALGNHLGSYPALLWATVAALGVL